MEEFVGLYDDNVGAGDDFLVLEPGKPYRFYLMPLKLPTAEVANNVGVQKAVAARKAKRFKKGEPGWFGPEEDYVLFPGLTCVKAWYMQGHGYFRAPKDVELTKKYSERFGEAFNRYGCVVLWFGTSLTGEIIPTPHKPIKVDCKLMKFRFDDIKAGQLQKATQSVTLSCRDLSITAKKQGRGIRWDTIDPGAEATILMDDLVPPDERTKLFEMAAKMRKSMEPLLAKQLPDAELAGLYNSASPSDLAKNVPPPSTEQNIQDLLK